MMERVPCSVQATRGNDSGLTKLAQMYNLNEYSEMLKDTVRVESYVSAIRELVPGKRVLELGGGTGFFACIAAKAGAAHVTSIELSPQIKWGPVTAQANGVGNIHFILGRSQEFSSEVPYDIILHDLRGSTPFFQNSMETLQDAKRLLAPEGVFLARSDSVQAGLVQDEQFFQHMLGVWGGAAYGLTLEPLGASVHRLMRYTRGDGAELLSESSALTVSYDDVRELGAEVETVHTVSTGGLCHGLVLWFDTVLSDKVGFSTNPWKQQRGKTYGNTFVPWPKPFAVREGDEIVVVLKIDRYGNVKASAYKKLGALRVQLGSFDRLEAESDTPVLPVQSRFEKHPVSRAYRVAFQSLEEGRSVKDSIKKIRAACPDLRDDQTAANVLVRCAGLTQAPTRESELVCKQLGFRGARVSIRTNDRKLLKSVLQQLPKFWTRVASDSLENPVVDLRRVVTLNRSGYSIVFAGGKTLHDSFDSALERLHGVLTHSILIPRANAVVLDCGFERTKDGNARLVLSDDYDLRRRYFESRNGEGEHKISLLSFDCKLIDFSERTPRRRNRELHVSELLLLQNTPVKDSLMLSYLLGRCLSVRRLESPLEFFKPLVESARVVTSVSL